MTSQDRSQSRGFDMMVENKDIQAKIEDKLGQVDPDHRQRGESAVIRRKATLISDKIDFSIRMQKKYRQLGLLTNDMLQKILPEQTNKGQMARFLKLAMAADPSKAFQKIQEILRAEHHSWLADELTVDVLAELGQLNIDKHIELESAMIVHKFFGTSKRITESERNEMTDLIAVRTQANKEMLQMQLMRTQQERDDAVLFKKQEIAKLKELVNKIDSFLKINKIRMQEQNRGSGLEALEDEENEEVLRHEYLCLLEGDVDKLIEMLSRAVFQRERVADERKKCFRILGLAKGAKANIALDVAIENALKHAAQNMEKSQREVEHTDQLAQDLDTRLRNAQIITANELAAKDRQIAHMDYLDKQHRDKVADLKQDLEDSKKEYQNANQEIIMLKKKLEMLEKTRRLGFFQPGWQEKAYEEIGADPNAVKDGQALIPIESPRDGGSQSKKKQTTGQTQPARLGNSKILTKKASSSSIGRGASKKK